MFTLDSFFHDVCMCTWWRGASCHFLRSVVPDVNISRRLESFHLTSLVFSSHSRIHVTAAVEIHWVLNGLSVLSYPIDANGFDSLKMFFKVKCFLWTAWPLCYRWFSSRSQSPIFTSVSGQFAHFFVYLLIHIGSCANKCTCEKIMVEKSWHLLNLFVQISKISRYLDLHCRLLKFTFCP